MIILGKTPWSRQLLLKRVDERLGIAVSVVGVDGGAFFNYLGRPATRQLIARVIARQHNVEQNAYGINVGAGVAL